MVDQPLHFTPPPPPRTPGQPSERLIIVSGLSGAGKTVALRTLEDLDYYCVDNLPTALSPSKTIRLTRACDSTCRFLRFMAGRR